MKYNPQISHAIYQKLVRISKAHKGSLVQASFLQLEVPLAAGSLRFAIAETDASVTRRATEQRLNQNDMFVATKLGLYLKQEVTTSPGSVTLQTYPNAQTTAFTAEATFLTVAHLISAWNSKLTVKVGDRVYAKAIDMHKSLYIPQTQQASTTTFSQKDSYDGMFDLEPIIAFEGQDANDLTLQVPVYTGQQIQNSVAVTTLVYAVLKMDGFLITQGSGLAKAVSREFGLQ